MFTARKELWLTVQVAIFFGMVNCYSLTRALFRVPDIEYCIEMLRVGVN